MRSFSRCPRRPPEDRPMLSFDEEAGLTPSIPLTPPIPGLAIQPTTGFVPTGAGKKEELAPAGDAFRRITVEDKRVINSKADLNQLVPFKYKWAWEKYLAACAIHWIPQKTNMTPDIELGKAPRGLTDDEGRLANRNLGFFPPPDPLAANNIALGPYRHITAPE